MRIENVFYLPSGRVFLVDCGGYKIECTEMRDVAVDGKLHREVRESTDPHVIWKHLVPYEKKWLLTVSTQKGCVHNCEFCDVAPLPFKGNLSKEEILGQVSLLLSNTAYVKKCRKAKIGFARMGEPAHNLNNVIESILALPNVSKELDRDFNWLPCFNTILPISCKHSPREVLEKVIHTKENAYDGFLHVQISCNSTDEETRTKLFGGSPVFAIEDIVNFVNKSRITSRTITLNFIVMKDVEVSVRKLKKMGLSGDRFAVKLIPLNRTIRGEELSLETLYNYKNYEELLFLRDKFKKEGIPVVVDAIAKCEEAGLCCGQLVQIFQ